MTLPTVVLFGIKASLGLTMVGVGLAASPRDAISVFRTPGRLARSLTAMMFIVPIFAVVVARAFELETSVKIALGALSLSPVPPLWPNKSRRAGGEETYTIGLLVATAVLSILIIPLGLDVFGIIFDIALGISPTKVAQLVLTTILLPLAIGMAVKHFASGFSYRVARPLSRLASALLAASAAPLLVKFWPALTTLVGDGTLLTMIAFVAVGLVAGHVLGGPPAEDRCVLALASATRHPGIALAIAQVNFPNEKLVPAAILLYLIVSAAATMPYVRWTRRHLRPRHRTVMALR